MAERHRRRRHSTIDYVTAGIADWAASNSAAPIVGQAFDDALGVAGGRLPVWLVLLNLTVRRPANQRELAAGVGIGEATLTHHLNAMKRSGLITCSRDAANRRSHVITLTPAGRRLFEVLREAAGVFRPAVNARGDALLDTIAAANPAAARFVPLTRTGDGGLEPEPLRELLKHGFGIVRWHPIQEGWPDFSGQSPVSAKQWLATARRSPTRAPRSTPLGT